MGEAIPPQRVGMARCAVRAASGRLTASGEASALFCALRIPPAAAQAGTSQRNVPTGGRWAPYHLRFSSRFLVILSHFESHPTARTVGPAEGKTATAADARTNALLPKFCRHNLCAWIIGPTAILPGDAACFEAYWRWLPCICSCSYPSRPPRFLSVQASSTSLGIVTGSGRSWKWISRLRGRLTAEH